MLLLDAMGERYSMLPSKVMKEGDSFDLMVFDVSMSYKMWQQKKDNSKDVTDMYDQDQLKDIMSKAKNGNNG